MAELVEEEEKEEAPIEAPIDEEDEKKPRRLMPVLIAIPVVAALAFFLVTKVVNPRLAPLAEDLLVVADTVIAEEVESVIWPLGAEVTNLSGGNKLRFIKIAVSLELASPLIEEKVEKRRERLGDVFLTILSSKTFEEMKSPDGKRGFKAELKKRFTSELGLSEGDIRRIYFSDFIIQ